MPLRHTFIADCETPVSAYLKLRGEGPSFLLESAEQGQRFGRWSFLGFRPRAVIRVDDGVLTAAARTAVDDPYAAVADELERYRARAARGPAAVRRRRGRPVRLRPRAPRRADRGRAQPRRARRARPGADGRPTCWSPSTTSRHEVTVLANVFAEDDARPAPTPRPPRPIADVRERLAGPVPRASARARPSRRSSSRTSAPRATPRRSSAQGVHPRGRRLPGRARASAGAPTRRSRRSRSTAGCARSTRARTCTSSTSRTSRSPAPRRSRWSRSTGRHAAQRADRRHAPARRDRRGGR